MWQWNFWKSDLSDENRQDTIGWLYFSKQEKYKVEQKYNCRVYQSISTSLYTNNMPNSIKYGGEKSKKQKTESNTNKYNKMERIKPLSTCYIKRDDQNNGSWYNEEYLKRRKKHMKYVNPNNWWNYTKKYDSSKAKLCPVSIS